MTPKRSISDLAALGGIPAFASPLHVGRPHPVDRSRLLARIEDLLDRRWLTNCGPYVQQLERQVATQLGVRHCVATCNGTAALEIMIRAAGLQGEVIVPAFTFVATPHAIRWLGLTPVFCDIDPHTHAIDPAAVERLISPQTTAIMGVHIWGQACPIEELAAIAERQGIALVFDAAQAFGNLHRGRCLGSFGTAEAVSFHATKTVSTFEGGAILTDNDRLADRARRMRNFGLGDDDQAEMVGTNAKMSEVAAAMGVTMLEQMDDLFAANRAVYRQYAAELHGIPGVQFFEYDADVRNPQYVVVELEQEVIGLSRDTILSLLRAENVLARRYFFPGCHRLMPYRSLDPQTRAQLPVTDAVADRVLCLPTGGGLSAPEVAGVCALLRFVVANAAAVSTQLGKDKLPAGGKP